MDLPLNNLQRSIYHKTKSKQTLLCKHFSYPTEYIYIHISASPISNSTKQGIILIHQILYDLQ